MPLVEELYALETDEQEQALLGALAASLRLEQGAEDVERRILLDSFDWRVHRDGGTLLAEPSGEHVVLRWLRDGGEPRRCRCAGLPAFPGELPEGEFSRDLADVLEMRRVLPLAELSGRGRTLRVLDERRKTVARLRLACYDVSDPRNGKRAPLTGKLLRIDPVRGYEPYHRQVREAVRGVGLEAAERDLAAEALRALERRPGDYSSKIAVQLDPEQTAVEAVGEILRSLLRTMRANEAGLREDLDSEFLHDFRVAGRRTRSALSQLKGVFTKQAIAPFRAGFKWLGQASNLTRDLDVYLLKMPGYRQELPEAVREALAPLATFLERHKLEAHRELVAELDSPRYAELVASWQAFLEQPPEEGLGKRAELPILEFARRRIWRIYRTVISDGEAIGPETPAEALHQLRIDCKKLRYLLEFFRSLFGKRVAKSIQALKKLQDNLGDFNDFVVQQDALGGFAEQMAAEGIGSVQTQLAIGQLIAHLEAGRLQEQERFHARFEKFASKENRARFGELFGPDGDD